MNYLSFALQILLLIVGFYLLMKGADWFVDGASKIADYFHIPALIIGLTIVAFGTSAPEAAISITAAIKGNADITMGNVIGSNIFNILVILGITACILPLAIQKSTKKFELPFVIIITIVLALLGGFDHEIGSVDAAILWGFFIVFFIYLILLARKGESVADDIAHVEKNENLFKIILGTILGMVAIIVGSDVTVDSATNIATTLNMSERLIGLTIIAFGTSLPELITSITAAKKGKADIAIGNIVGSNIFNILFVIGATAVIAPVPFAASFSIDIIIAIGAAILLYVCILRDSKLKRSAGIAMLVCYAAYFVYLLVK